MADKSQALVATRGLYTARNQDQGQSSTRKHGGGRLVPISGLDVFQFEWTRFIHRVKIHELLHCLQNEQKKLSILREHVTDIHELLVQQGRRFEEPEDILYMKSLELEKAEASILAEEIRKVETDSDFVSRSALQLFDTKVDINEEQFEEILQLCKDKQQQKQLRDAFHGKRNREKYLYNASERRVMLYDFVNSHFFNRLLLLLIASSTLIIFLLTFEFIEIRHSFPLRICDSVIFSIFLVEALTKISIYKTDYFKSVWNLLDCGIIFTHFLEVSLELITKLLALTTNIDRNIFLRLLRSMRSLRLLRTIKFLPNLQVIVSTIFQSLISLSSIAALMVIIMIVFAVIGRGLFKESDPTHFQTILSSMLTLFQLLTLDDWIDLPGDFEKDIRTTTGDYFVFVVYLFIYILFEYFVFLNLFVAVLVDNFQLSLEEAQYGETKHEIAFDKAEVIGLAHEEEKSRLKEESELRKNAGADLSIGDYYGLDNSESSEMKLMHENLKLLTAIDFEDFMLARRMNLAGVVLDVGVESKKDTWGAQEILDVDLPADKAKAKDKDKDNDKNKGKDKLKAAGRRKSSNASLGRRNRS